MNWPLWNTQNDLAEKVRTGALDLALQAKQAHWNVKGPSFIALHELFDELVDAVLEHADELAERAVELGDADTADLFTEISRSVDKLLWKVEAHGQAKD